MSFRIAALLCLSGLTACSNTTTTEPANDANSATNDAGSTMRPASFEADGARDEQGTPNGTAVTGESAPVGPGVQSPSTAPVTGTTPAAPSPAAGAELAPRDPAAPPDNTKVNERDRSSAALTPVDQGNNKSDLDITQRIRKGVMADDSLSFTAKNVKIITTGGKVTLRGPVKTEQERDAIYAAARQVVGATQIDNQIEVKK